MQELITEAEQRYISAEGFHQIDTSRSSAGDLPNPTEPLDDVWIPVSPLADRLFWAGISIGSALLAGAVALLITAKPAHAEPITWWSNLGGVSVHDEAGRNGQNPGLGIEARTSRAWAFGAGQFRNSQSLQSNYLTAIYTPWQPARRVHLGAMAAVVDGYPMSKGRPMLAAGLVAEVRWQAVALSATLIPSVDRRTQANAVGVQLKLNFGGL